MATFQLRLTTIPNAVPRHVSDEAEVERLTGWVRNAVKASKAPPAAVVLRPERTEVIVLAPVAQARFPMARFLGGLCRSTADGVGMAQAVGVIGVFRAHRDPKREQPPVPMAVVFLEWPDNRWYFWRALVDPDKREVLEHTAMRASAAEGDPLPGSFGRWWALARRANLTLHLSRRDGPEGAGPTSPVVN